MRPLVVVLSFGVVGSLRFSRLPSSRRTVLPRCAVEPTQRGITASALLYALEDDSRRHEKVLVREAYAFGSDVEPPFP